MKREKLEKTVRARVSKETYRRFIALLDQEEEGVNESDLFRRAIREYLDSRDPKKAKAARIKADSDETL